MIEFEAALAATFAPFSLLMLASGVLFGLFLGVMPGIGGLFGMVLLVPLTYHMDPYAAIALLLGLASVTTTSDTIPAVLVGVPGSVGSITTVLDGHPLARQGQASRAFGAAYLASLTGGVFGALVLALSIPVMRPLIMAMKTPDFLAVSVVGLLFVSFVSGSDALKGLAAVLAGIMLSFIGLDPIGGAERYTGGSMFLWDGLPLAATFLGLFGLSEIADLVRRRAISEAGPSLTGSSSQLTGFKDTIREWRLVLQCSSIGALIGAIPGVGVIVIDWIAYGFAARHRRGGPPFGEGNIRGVIAPESANNAKEGGALIPTIAFGVPASAGMTILVAALAIHGVAPGPDMLGRNLSVTYSMVFCIALANIMGAVICMIFTRPLARLTSVPTHFIVPVALVFLVLGIFHANVRLENMVVLLAFGAIGMFMKARTWPRAALAMGFILGPNVERYFFLSYQISGFDWLTRPSVLLTFAGATILALRLATRRKRASASAAPPDAGWSDPLSYVLLGGAALLGFTSLSELPWANRLFPQAVSGALLAVAVLLLGRYFIRGDRRALNVDVLAAIRDQRPAIVVLLSCALVTALIYLVGHVAAAFLFVAGFVAVAQRVGWKGPLLTAAGTVVMAWMVFDWFVSAPWPAPMLFTALGGR